MTIVSLEAKIEDLQGQLETYKRMLEALKAQYSNGDPVGRWKPQEDERYYSILASGDIAEYTFQSNYEIDQKMYLHGNCFKTLEEAEYMEERLKLLAELQQWCESKDRYWGEGYKHYFIGYDYENDDIIISSHEYINTGVVHFSTEEAAKEAIKTIGQERLKKYYFGVRR